jgi:thiosulfate/3-mercaptopyruvate sulfurtransferase
MQHSTLISTEALAGSLADPSLVIVDCRHNLSDVDAGEAAYRSAHLPGAFFLHLDRDLSGAKTGGNGRHPLPDRETLEIRTVLRNEADALVGVPGRRGSVGSD